MGTVIENDYFSGCSKDATDQPDDEVEGADRQHAFIHNSLNGGEQVWLEGESICVQGTYWLVNLCYLECTANKFWWHVKENIKMLV